MKLFISYSHKDKDFVVKLYNTLTASNLEVFIDEKDIKIGDNILETIEKGIQESTGLLYVISKHSIKSRWVKEELSMAKVKAITQRDIYTIFPLLIDDVSLPLSLAKLKYADFKEWNVNEKYYREVSRLLSSLGIKSSNIKHGQIEFVAKNFTTLTAVIQSSKLIIGLVEGAVDFFYYVRARHYSPSDVANRIIKMNQNVGSNTHILLDDLRKRVLESNLEFKDSLLQIINECANNISQLENFDGNRQVFSLTAKSFNTLSKTLSDLLNDFNRETSVLIIENN